MSALFFAAIATISSVITLAGLVTVFIGLRRASKARRTVSWPSVKGTVLSAEVKSSDSEQGGPPTHRALIHYRYEVGGKSFENDLISFDQLETSDPGAAADAVRSHPTGATIDVFYAPTNPANAVLRPGISSASIIIPAVGVAVFMLGLVLLGVVWFLSMQYRAR